MSGFDDITVNKRGTVTCIGAGQKWINVYRKLDAMGLAVSGGRVGSVGVAGLTLGGLSPLSTLVGFADWKYRRSIVLLSAVWVRM